MIHTYLAAHALQIPSQPEAYQISNLLVPSSTVGASSQKNNTHIFSLNTQN